MRRKRRRSRLGGCSRQLLVVVCEQDDFFAACSKGDMVRNASRKEIERICTFTGRGSPVKKRITSVYRI